MQFVVVHIRVSVTVPMTVPVTMTVVTMRIVIVVITGLCGLQIVRRRDDSFDARGRFFGAEDQAG